MTNERIFYKLLLRENGRLRSFNDERIVYYDENVDVRDEYPLFVFDTYSDASLFMSWLPYVRCEIWNARCINYRPLKYGKTPTETHERFWFSSHALQYLRVYDNAGVTFDTSLPRGTYVCDSLRLVERVF